MSKRPPIVIAGEAVAAGESKCIKLSLSMLHTSTPIEVPVYVFHGKKEGPILFVTAAIHGDELNGVEIIRRLHHSPRIKNLHGTLITIPIVNVYGFFLQSRYLPDRRDLNRQFPGRNQGSLAARLAHLIMNEIVIKSTHGIDLHTGAIHRSNYPQTRFSGLCTQAESLAQAFAAPVMIPSNIRDGSLRSAADSLDIPLIIYEAGEALRFDEFSIKIGVRGILKAMTYLGMIRKRPHHKEVFNLPIAKSTLWVRTPVSGMLVESKTLGMRVTEGKPLFSVVDPLQDKEEIILAPCDGLIIGKSNIPLVNEGDAIFHLASFSDLDALDLPFQEQIDWET